jgi:hypothetical protein
MRAKDFITESHLDEEDIVPAEKEMLDEGATSVLYHYTNIQPALKILQNGAFELTASTGNKSEEKFEVKGYPYYLSTTRSKVGDYHRYAGSSAVMFVLDGNWLGQRYPVKPVDYWERMWSHSTERTRESEDRVFSKEPSIPTGAVREIHVLLKEQNEQRSPAARKLLLLAKKQGIPAFMYTDEQAWRLQDKRKALSIKQATPVLKGVEPSSRTYQSYGSLDPWFELIYKKSVAELTPKANKLRTNILYYARPHEDNNLAIDLSNERKPNSSDRESAIKLIDYMRKNGFATPLDLKNALVAKWKDIK